MLAARRCVIPTTASRAFSRLFATTHMESNEKSVTRTALVATATRPVILANPAPMASTPSSNCCIREPDVTPIDFLIARSRLNRCASPRAAVRELPGAERSLHARRTLDEPRSLLRKEGRSEADIERLAPHKVFSATARPASPLSPPRPAHAGRLWRSMNTRYSCSRRSGTSILFDQWASNLARSWPIVWRPSSEHADASTAALDGSTAGLIQWRRNASRL